MTIKGRTHFAKLERNKKKLQLFSSNFLKLYKRMDAKQQGLWDSEVWRGWMVQRSLEMDCLEKKGRKLKVAKSAEQSVTKIFSSSSWKDSRAAWPNPRFKIEPKPWMAQSRGLILFNYFLHQPQLCFISAILRSLTPFARSMASKAAFIRYYGL